MKYIITESQLKKAVIDYIDFLMQNYDVIEKDLRRGGIVGTNFISSKNDESLLRYYPKTSYNTEKYPSESNKFPKLSIGDELLFAITEMFGDEGPEYVKDWFEKTYKLPVKTLYY